jgi:RNA polymerase sigma-70 factor, ECF subfamily
MLTATVTEQQRLIDAANAGDERAFEELVAPHRRLLQAHCYRMLGSTHDAEDAMQETLLRAWRSLSAFAGRSSLRSWLYKIATNACLRTLERRRARVLPADRGSPTDPSVPLKAPMVESTWIEPYLDELLDPSGVAAGPENRFEQRESVELAFIAALQHLPPRQRAVLILRDVLGFSGAEVADALETTPASVYSALQRAHEAVDHRLPQRSQQATLRALGDARLQEIVGAYVRAWESDDVDALAAMLTEDAILAMPPTPSWYRGRDAVLIGLRTHPLNGELRWRLTPTRANGQLAMLARIWEPALDEFVLVHTAVLTLRDDLIAQIDTFIEPAHLHGLRGAGTSPRPWDDRAADL